MFRESRRSIVSTKNLSNLSSKKKDVEFCFIEKKRAKMQIKTRSWQKSHWLWHEFAILREKINQTIHFTRLASRELWYQTTVNNTRVAVAKYFFKEFNFVKLGTCLRKTHRHLSLFSSMKWWILRYLSEECFSKRSSFVPNLSTFYNKRFAWVCWLYKVQEMFSR